MSSVATEPGYRVVIAPDSFKGTATAVEVAEALARGWRGIRGGDDIVLVPMADGGEGTVDAFAVAVPGSRRMPVTVVGPDDRPVDTDWLLLPDGSGVVELASTSGITLLDPLRPLTAHTRGFGQAIAAALDHGVTRLLLALGGSSSTDGAAGALRELGARLLDAEGAEIGDGGAALADLASVDVSELRALPEGGAVILSDVTNPLLGRTGAAAVFGPQKGATADDVAALDGALARFARVLAVAVGEGADASTPGTGAAGGAGFGLLAWGAAIAPGSGAVGDALGVPGVVAGADLVITGEGRFDRQSLDGKVPSYLLEVARGFSIPVVLVAGAVQAPEEANELFATYQSLSALAGSSAAAMAAPIDWLERAGRELAASVFLP